MSEVPWGDYPYFPLLAAEGHVTFPFKWEGTWWGSLKAMNTDPLSLGIASARCNCSALAPSASTHHTESWASLQQIYLWEGMKFKETWNWRRAQKPRCYFLRPALTKWELIFEMGRPLHLITLWQDEKICAGNHVLCSSILVKCRKGAWNSYMFFIEKP